MHDDRITPKIAGLSPLAARLLLDAAYLHDMRVYATASARVSDGSYSEYGPLNVHAIEDACREMRAFVDALAS